MSGEALKITANLLDEVGVSGQVIVTPDFYPFAIEILGSPPKEISAEALFAALENPKHLSLAITWFRKALSTALETAAKLKTIGGEIPLVSTNFPISFLEQKVSRDEFIGLIQQATKDSQFPPERLILEVSERDALRLAKPGVMRNLEELIKATRVGFALDDIDSIPGCTEAAQLIEWLKRQVALGQIITNTKALAMLKVNGAIVDEISRGNLKGLQEIITVAQELGFRMVVLERIRTIAVREIQRLAIPDGMQIGLQSYELTSKEPIALIKKHFNQ